MKTLQERSEQMVNLKKIGERAHLVIQYRETAVILKDVPCSDAGTWLSLQEEAGSLRAMLHAALTDYAEEVCSDKSVDRLLSRSQPTEVDSQTGLISADGGRVEASMPTTVGVQRSNYEKILYGLPCPQCGAYFDSGLTVCPYCSHRCTEFGPQVPAERESCNEPLTLQ